MQFDYQQHKFDMQQWIERHYTFNINKDIKFREAMEIVNDKLTDLSNIEANGIKEILIKHNCNYEIINEGATEFYNVMENVCKDLKDAKLGVRTKKSIVNLNLERSLNAIGTNQHKRVNIFEPIKDILQRPIVLELEELEDSTNELYREYNQFKISFNMIVFYEMTTCKAFISKAIVTDYIHLIPTNRYGHLAMYPRLYEVVDKYVKSKKQEETKEDVNLLKVPSNSGLMDIAMNLNTKDFTSCKNNLQILEKKTSKNNSIYFTGEKQENLRQVFQALNEKLTREQINLFVYMSHLALKNNCKYDSNNTINLNVKDYCIHRGIEYRSDTANKIHDNISIFNNFSISFKWKDAKGKEHSLENATILGANAIKRVKDIRTGRIEQEVIKIKLGLWTDAINTNQFQLVSNDFFIADRRNSDSSYSAIHLQLSNSLRLNVKNKNDYVNIKVSTLTEKMPIEESTIKHKGYKNTLKKSLENNLNKLSKEESYPFTWKYKNGQHKNRDEFENDIIIISNEKLGEIYSTINKKNK